VLLRGMCGGHTHNVAHTIQHGCKNKHLIEILTYKAYILHRCCFIGFVWNEQGSMDFDGEISVHLSPSKISHFKNNLFHSCIPHTLKIICDHPLSNNFYPMCHASMAF
jgi:hypothetical protein